MKQTQPNDKDSIDKLNAFYIYKTAGFERVKEILPQQTHFCEANSNKSYTEMRTELLKSNKTGNIR